MCCPLAHSVCLQHPEDAMRCILLYQVGDGFCVVIPGHMCCPAELSVCLKIVIFASLPVVFRVEPCEAITLGDMVPARRAVSSSIYRSGSQNLPFPHADPYMDQSHFSPALAGMHPKSVLDFSLHFIKEFFWKSVLPHAYLRNTCLMICDYRN